MLHTHTHHVSKAKKGLQRRARRATKRKGTEDEEDEEEDEPLSVETHGERERQCAHVGWWAIGLHMRG